MNARMLERFKGKRVTIIHQNEHHNLLESTGICQEIDDNNITLSYGNGILVILTNDIKEIAFE